jgi:hypothetical protein
VQVEFKSDPEFFRKEHNGSKPNTVREVDEADRRFIALRKGQATTIRITSTKTGQSFMRVITDVSFYKNLCIISWEAK